MIDKSLLLQKIGDGGLPGLTISFHPLASIGFVAAPARLGIVAKNRGA
jgi:hypothetical protein